MIEDAPERLDREGLVPVVRAEGSWELFADGDDLLFAMRTPGDPGETLWTARSDRGFNEVVIGTDLRQSGPAGADRLTTNCLQYPLDQVLVMHALDGRGLIVHAGAAVRRGRALLYAGVSGAGKTTLSRHLESAGFTVLSDDRVVVRRDDGAFTAWGTPWPGEGGQARNEGAPLAGVLVLDKGTSCSLTEVAPTEALSLLLPVLSIPWYDPEAATGPLTLLDELLTNIPCRRFTFTPGPEAAAALAGLLDDLP